MYLKVIFIALIYLLGLIFMMKIPIKCRNSSPVVVPIREDGNGFSNSKWLNCQYFYSPFCFIDDISNNIKQNIPSSYFNNTYLLLFFITCVSYITAGFISNPTHFIQLTRIFLIVFLILPILNQNNLLNE